MTSSPGLAFPEGMAFGVAVGVAVVGRLGLRTAM